MLNRVGFIIRFGTNTESSRIHYLFSKRILKRVGFIIHFKLNTKSSGIHYLFWNEYQTHLNLLFIVGMNTESSVDNQNEFWINFIIIHE